MKKKRKKMGTSKSAKKADATTSSSPIDQDEKPFDFGGLPQRDLKKNLGCG
jgi:hypothetical protein